jgi:NAD(P)-dependent dehydrogenase (short-subunit alcohol dehydrogenase family)
MVDQLVDAGQGGVGQEGDALGVARNDLAALLGVGDDPEEGFLRAGDGGGQLLGGVRVVFAVYIRSRRAGFPRGGAEVSVVVRVADVLGVGHEGHRTGRTAAVAAEARGSAEVRRLDLADLAFAQELAERWEGRPIDLLINSVGEMMLSEQRARDGFEMQFGANRLGHFTLSNLLLPYVTDRVVTVSSGMHRAGYGAIRFDDLNLSWGYAPVRAYAQSKPANLLFTLGLQRRPADAGSPVRALAAHPGCGDESAEPCRQSGGSVGVVLGNRLFAQDGSAGALPTLYAAVRSSAKPSGPT